MTLFKRAKKYRSVSTASPSRKKQITATGTKELVLTLSIPGGEVVKVEMLNKSGQRTQLSEEEFAELAGEDEEVSPEEAYAAGITDAGDEDEFELDDEGSVNEEALERFILREMVARQLLRNGVRRFILHRLRKRETIRRQSRARSEPVSEAGYKARKNGHESTKEGG